MTGATRPDASGDVRGLAVLLYALTGGVVWWVFHLVGLSALVPAVCDGTVPHAVLSAVNVVALVGAGSGLWASRAAPQMSSSAGTATGRTAFLAGVAVLFNATALGLIVLEGIPVYVLETCS